MSAIPFLSRVLQFPTVPIDCHLVLESLLNHVVSENELQLPVFQPNDEQDWTLSEDLNCCSPECSVFGEAHSETVSSINSPRGSVGSQPPLDRKKLEERIQVWSS